MSEEEIIEFLTGLEAVLTLRPTPGDGSPEISWGDTFFYYAPDGVVPKAGQPFATIVTKDYPGESSALNRPGAFRVNFHAGKEAFVRWTGHQPRDPIASEIDPNEADAVIAHPVYGSLGWLAVINPGPRTSEAVRGLLSTAHDLARARYQRRTDTTSA